MQQTVPWSFQLLPHAGVLADLALWLSIRFLRKEAMFQVALCSVAPGAAEHGYVIPSFAGDSNSDQWCPDLQCRQ
jgi:hypothetical protein